MVDDSSVWESKSVLCDYLLVGSDLYSAAFANLACKAAVNYTDRETPWTRIIEHKWFEFGKDEKNGALYAHTKSWPTDSHKAAVSLRSGGFSHGAGMIASVEGVCGRKNRDEKYKTIN